MLLIQNPHGPVGCWLPAWVVDASLIWRALACLLAVAGATIGWKRVQDEEMMLKNEFGKEWEHWHVRTSRMIPGLF